MLGIFILVGIASLFYNTAKKNNLNKVAWLIYSILAFFGAQVIVGFIIAIIDPSLIYNTIMITVTSLISSLIGVLILWFIMQSAIKNKTKITDSNLLDDNLLDDNLK